MKYICFCHFYLLPGLVTLEVNSTKAMEAGIGIKGLGFAAFCVKEQDPVVR